MKWPLVELHELCEINIGRTPSRSNQKYWGEGAPWLSIADMNQGLSVTSTKEQITEEAISECGCKPVAPGTALLSFKLSIGKVGIAARQIYTNEAIAALPIKNATKLHSKYLIRALQFLDLTSGADRAAKGGTLNKQSLSEIQVPLPPLAEQKRIALILDAADALRAKRRAALAKLDQLAQSIFIEMFGDGAAKDPEWRKVGDVAELVNGDRSSNYPSGDDLVSEGILFLSTRNINDNELDLTTCSFITPEKFESLTRGKLQRGDLIITLRGTLGQVAKFDCEHDTGFINAQMMIIRPSTTILSDYLLAVFSQPITQSRLKTASSGSAVPQLTSKQISELGIAVPPLAKQQAFVKKLAHAQHLKQGSTRQLRSLEGLFLSLQHRAFKGDL